ncbi:ATP-binding protein, partial [Enterobacter cloacae]|uniref:ATP-binding protein n=1 Tax=Enterobacter cloacae TaxID=550 RepID=UPI0020037A97
MNLQYERIEQLCRQLGLQTVASQWSHHAQQTLAKDGSYADFVEAMLLHEYTAKQQRSQQILLQLSGLTQIKTLEAYDFNGTVAKLAMRQPFVLFKGLTFQKLCLPGAFRPGDHHN